MDLPATMIVTAVGNRTSPAVALSSMPVSDLTECRRAMTAYIDDMPDTEVTGRGQNYIVGKVKQDEGGIVTFYVKCQNRGN